MREKRKQAGSWLKIGQEIFSTQGVVAGSDGRALSRYPIDPVITQA
jgi:hypothetical protein